MSKIYTPIKNDKNDIKAIADGYKKAISKESWLVAGLQKDAIQNSWDAKKGRHGYNWQCTFGIKEIGGIQYLYIEDRGTSGLRGTVFNNLDELTKILLGNERGEDLSYFLNSNWSAKTVGEGGNRGRGKTLFLISSQKSEFLFETLRDDNVYIFGKYFLDTDKQIKFKIEQGIDAESEFHNFNTGALLRLKEVGTRIFISKPRQEVVEAIKNGTFYNYIAHTWWEIIKKYNAKIVIDNGLEAKIVKAPYWYEDELSGEMKSIPYSKFEGELIKKGCNYKIKRLVIRYAKDVDLPEEVRGIAIQRGGMTIERYPAEDLVHEEGTNNIYGWVELEGDKSKLEEEIKNNCEGPEHFNFSWHIKPAKYLREYLKVRLRQFINIHKIGKESSSEKNELHKKIETEIVRLLSPLFKELSLTGKHKGKSQTKDIHKRRENEKIRLSVKDIKFPRENRRINHSERITGTSVLAINESDESYLVLVRVWIVSEDGKFNKNLAEDVVKLQSNTNIKIGPDSLIIDNKNFKKGSYFLKAKMISYEDTNKKLPDGSIIEKGTKLYDSIHLKFFVETDPPEHGPFSLQEEKRPGEKRYLIRWERNDDDSYTIFYNGAHPQFISITKTNEEAGLKSYLLDMVILVTLQLKLEQLDFKDEEKDWFSKELSSMMKNKKIDWEKFLPLVLNKYSETLWDIKE